MQSSFKIGDVVQLKSGGPLMTVSAVQDEGLWCVWFEKSAQKGGRFKPETVSLYHDE